MCRDALAALQSEQARAVFKHSSAELSQPAVPNVAMLVPVPLPPVVSVRPLLQTHLTALNARALVFSSHTVNTSVVSGCRCRHTSGYACSRRDMSSSSCIHTALHVSVLTEAHLIHSTTSAHVHAAHHNTAHTVTTALCPKLTACWRLPSAILTCATICPV